MAASRPLSSLALLVLIIATLPAAARCRQAPAPTGRETVVIEGHSFDLEVAATEPTRTRGLMDRREIPEEGGMLFIFTDDQPRWFWMKNCYVDIDLIFLDAQGRVTALHRMKALPPRREDETEAAYDARMRRSDSWSNLPARFAIELKSGWLDRLHLQVDDKIELDLPRLKASAR